MSQTLTRRGIGAVASAAVVAVALPAIATGGSNPDAELLALGSELEKVHAARAAFDKAEPRAEDPNYERHWQLREEVNQISAATFAGVAVKARAAQMALHYDRFVENEGDGAFRNLSCSLIDDLLRITSMGGAHA